MTRFHIPVAPWAITLDQTSYIFPHEDPKTLPSDPQLPTICRACPRWIRVPASALTYHRLPLQVLMTMLHTPPYHRPPYHLHLPESKYLYLLVPSRLNPYQAYRRIAWRRRANGRTLKVQPYEPSVVVPNSLRTYNSSMLLLALHRSRKHCYFSICQCTTHAQTTRPSHDSGTYFYVVLRRFRTIFNAYFLYSTV
jgi:hypothetical protein